MVAKWSQTSKMSVLATAEPRFNEPLFNKVLDITNDILCPGQSYSKMYGIEPRFNEQIWTVPSDFVKSRFHCSSNFKAF